MRMARGLQRAAAALAVVTIIGLGGSAPAFAEDPFRLPTQITDQSGVLSGSDRSDVQAALDQLSAEDNIDLWVVYVDTFEFLSYVNF